MTIRINKPPSGRATGQRSRRLRLAAGSTVVTGLLLATVLTITPAGVAKRPVNPCTTHTMNSLACQMSQIHKIKHVVIIMQENRSFDSYFGTYPGADGIPGLAGHPGQGAVHPRSDSATLPEALPQPPTTSTPAGRTWRSTRSPTSTAAR